MKNKSIKVIMFDLDGTLLMDDKSVSPFSCRILNKLAEQGIILGIATGRPLSAIEKKLEILGLEKAITLVVGSNGSSIRNRATKQTEVIHYLPKEGINEVIKLYENTNGQLIFCSEDTAYSNKEGTYLDIVSFNNYLNKKVIDFKDLPLEIPKGGVYYLEEYGPEMEQILHDEYHYEQMPGNASGKNSIEFTHKSTNKGIALEKLLKSVKVSLDEVMSFGDADNDKSVLSKVGYPIAMINGTDEIKNMCVDITKDDNNHDGVAKYLLEHQGLFEKKKDYSKAIITLGIIGGVLFVASESLFKLFPSIPLIIQLISRVVILVILIIGIVLNQIDKR